MSTQQNPRPEITTRVTHRTLSDGSKVHQCFIEQRGEFEDVMMTIECLTERHAADLCQSIVEAVSKATGGDGQFIQF